MSQVPARPRLRDRQHGGQGPARRQGCQPRRDDPPRHPGAAGLHDHHGGLPGLPGARAPCRPSCSPRWTSTSPASRPGWVVGSVTAPTRCSCRSAPGAKFSMPGMMETVLNIGLNDTSVEGLAAQTGQPAVRLGLLPPPRADVRQDRARPRRPPLRGRPRRGQGTPRVSPTTSTWTPTTCAPSWRGSRPSSRRTPGRRSPRTPGRSCTVPSSPSSTPGTRRARSSTAAASTSPPTSARPSTSRPWPSATAAPTPARASRSPATPPPAPSGSTATTWPTPRARTSSPASATP